MTRTALLTLCLTTLAACGLIPSTDRTLTATKKPGGSYPSYSTSKSAIVEACPTSPASKVLTWGLCVCDTLDSVGDLVVSGSTGQGPARVGVNGLTHLVGTPKIEGSLIAYGGLQGVGEADVSGDLTTATDLEGVGRINVGGDLSVGGDLTGVGELGVTGTVRVKGTFSPVVGTQKIGGLGDYTAPELPCACGASALLDVAAKVAEAKLTHDNQRLGLPAELDLIGKANLTLDTGRFYFAGARTVGDTTIEIRGGVALFIDGDLETVGAQNFKLDPGATLDLYVSGNVSMVGDSDFAGAPGSIRIYVGGKSPVAVAVGNQTMKTSLYAPTAEVSFVGNTEIEGAVFAKTLTGVGTLTIRQADAAVPAADVCRPAIN